MTKIKYRVWDPDCMDEEDPETFEDVRPEYAAEGWVEREWSNLEYPSECKVFVKDPDGIITEWVVTVEQRPHFSACEVKAYSSDSSKGVQ